LAPSKQIKFWVDLTTYLRDSGEDRREAGKLRIVSATELHTEYLLEETSTPAESTDGDITKDGGTPDIDVVVGEVLRTNRETIDDPLRQKMTMDESKP